MIIQSKKLIPAIYSNSYDFSIFTGLIDLIYNARELDIQLLKGAHSPRFCAQESLRSLASLFNLDTDNRELIFNYRNLIKIKGTKKALEALAVLCGAVSAELDHIEDNNYNNYNNYNMKVESIDMNFNLFYSLLGRISPISIRISIIPKDY